MELSLEEIKEIKELQRCVSLINKDLNDKGMMDIEYLLINHSVEEILHLLEDSNVIYNVLKDNNIEDDVTFREYLLKYMTFAKIKIDNLMIPDGVNDSVARTYHRKLTEPIKNHGQYIIYPKTSINMSADDVQNTLKLMKEAIVAYYKAYYGKFIKATMSSGEIFEFRIKEQELLHLLGVTSRQLKNNPEFVRLTGNSNMKPEEILEWIIKDIEGNKDLVQLYEDSIKEKETEPSEPFSKKTDGILKDHYDQFFDRIILEKFQLYEEQYNDDQIQNRFLNYHKVRTKSQAFLKYGPFNKVSLVAKLKPGTSLTPTSNSNFAILSRADCFRLYPWAFFGSVQRQNDKYMETITINSAREKRDILEGSTPAVTVSVEIDNDSNGIGGRNGL